MGKREGRAVPELRVNSRLENNWPMMRNNKVGVEQSGGGAGGGGGAAAPGCTLGPGVGGGGVSGGGVTDVVTDDEDRSGSGTNLSAKMRASSGLSQFQEVDFSDQVCFYNGDSLKKAQTAKPPTLTNFEEEKGSIYERKLKRENWKKMKDDIKRKLNGGRGSRDYGEEMVDGSVKSEVPASVRTEYDIADAILSKTELVTMNVNGRKKVRKRLERSADGRLEGTESNSTAIHNAKFSGCGAAQDATPTTTELDSAPQDHHPKQYDTQKSYGNVGSSSGFIIRKEIPNGKGYTIGYKRNSSNSITKDGEPVPSTSTTVDTELSLHSTGEGDEEDGGGPPRRYPQSDEQEKPNLTPVSLAIYSNLSQEGPSRSRNFFLMGTAACTFIITVVLAVAILVAPKTLANKEDKTDRHPATTSITAAHNRSKNNHSEGLPLQGGRSELLHRDPNVTASLLMALRRPSTTIITWTSNSSAVRSGHNKTSASIDAIDTQLTSTSVEPISDSADTSSSRTNNSKVRESVTEHKMRQPSMLIPTPATALKNTSILETLVPTVTPTSTIPTNTYIPTSSTPTPTDTHIPATTRPTPTQTDTHIPATPTNIHIPNTPTPTTTRISSTPTDIHMAVTPTNTHIPATSTPTDIHIPATSTHIPPTPTLTNTIIPAIPTPTVTHIPVTLTPTPTKARVPTTLTSTDAHIPATPTPTHILVTPTPTLTPTNTHILVASTLTDTLISRNTHISATPTSAPDKKSIKPPFTHTSSTSTPTNLRYTPTSAYVTPTPASIHATPTYASTHTSSTLAHTYASATPTAKFVKTTSSRTQNHTHPSSTLASTVTKITPSPLFTLLSHGYPHTSTHTPTGITPIPKYLTFLRTHRKSVHLHAPEDPTVNKPAPLTTTTPSHRLHSSILAFVVPSSPKRQSSVFTSTLPYSSTPSLAPTPSLTPIIMHTKTYTPTGTLTPTLSPTFAHRHSFRFVSTPTTTPTHRRTSRPSPAPTPTLEPQGTQSNTFGVSYSTTITPTTPTHASMSTTHTRRHIIFMGKLTRTQPPALTHPSSTPELISTHIPVLTHPTSTSTHTPIRAYPTSTPNRLTSTSTHTHLPLTTLTTPTPTPTLTPAFTAATTHLPKLTRTRTPTLTPTNTRIPATPTSTGTHIPATPTPTGTHIPATPKSTHIPATPTPTKYTRTRTSTPTTSDTHIPPTPSHKPATPTPTDTHIPATPTSTHIPATPTPTKHTPRIISHSFPSRPPAMRKTINTTLGRT